MHPEISLPTLLGIAWLLPLVSFTIIVFFGPRLGKHGKHGSTVATVAILGSFACSLTAFIIWISNHGMGGAHHDPADSKAHAAITAPADKIASVDKSANTFVSQNAKHDDKDASHDTKAHAHADEHADDKHATGDHAGQGDHHPAAPPTYYSANWYTLGSIGSSLSLTIGYYIDALTVTMFTMVTLIASCIHFYASGYMHDELHDITDHEVTLTGNPYLAAERAAHGDAHGHDAHGHAPATHGTASHSHDAHVAPAATAAHDAHGHDAHGHDAHGHDDHGHASHGHAHGNHLVRPGRYHRFFQYLSLFCFSMLGLVYAGNVAMVFVFWELVGICSYFLIGFYRERKSASNAANKAFITNRVGDFGMLIGLMTLWSALGTFNFGDVKDASGVEQPGVFSLVRPKDNGYKLQVPDGMVRDAIPEQIAGISKSTPSREAAEAQIKEKVVEARNDKTNNYGYTLLIIAGVGIFCGCVGKSAQFPLHVWLPDAMEGPTPVSALVHSATMVAAGVYLVGRFFPVFAPEVLLVIAWTGAITLFLAATIAITATDIKRVLAYSTVSQLGYMMLALGLGGWLAGLLHLITHAFFKSLLFMCSGSVIHACHTNEMPKMGGLLRKMPYTGYTMLIGCLAIIGAGIPFALPGLGWVGTSGYYSKDSIIEQAVSFGQHNPGFWFQVLRWAPIVGAVITAFYMFRMWFMTFIGKPRDKHIYDHAHESPPVMYLPLVVLSFFAIGVAWRFLHLGDLLETARPAGTLATATGAMYNVVIPDEHLSHDIAIKGPATWMAFFTGVVGVGLAYLIYGMQKLNPAEISRASGPVYGILKNKWYFDEIYEFIFIKPVHFIARRAADFDRLVIDRIIHGAAHTARYIAKGDDLLDRWGVDGLVNGFAKFTRSIGYSFKGLQTGRLRQYVMFIAIGTILLFLIVVITASGSLASLTGR